jgi:hypothetical protein
VLQGLQAVPCPGAERGMSCPPAGQSAARTNHASGAADLAAGGDGGGGGDGAAARAAWAQRLRVVQEALILLRTLLRDRDLGAWLFASPVFTVDRPTRLQLIVTCIASEAGVTLQLWATKGKPFAASFWKSTPGMPTQGAIQATGG